MQAVFRQGDDMSNKSSSVLFRRGTLIEVSQQIGSGRRVWILCRPCAKKMVSEDNRRWDSSCYLRHGKQYSNGEYGGGKHYKRTLKTVNGYTATRLGQTVGAYEKLNCQKCGKKNEPE